jgi:hypothetical protein
MMSFSDVQNLRNEYYSLPNESARTEYLLKELRGFVDTADKTKKQRFFHIKVSTAMPLRARVRNRFGLTNMYVGQQTSETVSDPC